MTARKRESLVSQLESGSEGQVEMAAARSAVSAVYLMNCALETRGIAQRELAERVGVTESRVSQVLNGDGNVRLSTLAKFLRALGYSLKLSAEPAEAGVPPLQMPKPKRRRRETVSEPSTGYVTFLEYVAHTPAGVGRVPVIRYTPVHPAYRLSDATELVTLQVLTGQPLSAQISWRVLEVSDSDDKEAMNVRG